LDGTGFSRIRTFTPRLFLKNEDSTDTLFCFAAQVVRLYDENIFQHLNKRRGNLELIRFQPLRFYELDKNEIADNSELISGKIVLLGSMIEDAHKTPINPQMNGMEIHAHIISTILNEKYIKSINNIWTQMLSYLFCYLFTVFCFYAKTRLKKGVGMLIKLVNIAFLFFAFMACYYLFKYFNIDIVYTQAIVIMGVVLLAIDLYLFCITMGKEYIPKLKNLKNK
jgi:CHASE2 domain-containing sensor protein